MFFVFNLLNFRYFNEKLTGEKGIKEPNTGGMAQEEKPAGREREGKKRRTAAQVHDSFNSKMQYQIKYFYVHYIVIPVSPKMGFVCQQ